MEHEDHIAKDKMLVELVTMSGTTLIGFLFVAGSYRVQDLLNDTRNFLPFQYLDGSTVLLAKDVVANIVEIANITAIEDGFCPYASLGVRRDDSLEHIQAVYLELVQRASLEKYGRDEYPDMLRDQLKTVLHHIHAHYAKINGIVDQLKGQ